MATALGNPASGEDHRVAIVLDKASSRNGGDRGQAASTRTWRGSTSGSRNPTRSSRWAEGNRRDGSPVRATRYLPGMLVACDTATMRAAGVRRGTDLLFAPTAPPANGGLVALTCLRLLAGLIWLYNVVWKMPPDFGERSNSGLYHFTHLAIEH